MAWRRNGGMLKERVWEREEIVKEWWENKRMGVGERGGMVKE